MINSFHTEIAKEVGVTAAVIFYNISYWIEKNATNGKNMFDGNCWTYNSISAFEEQFEFLTSNQIRTALEKLVKNEVIIEGNYNSTKYDRTKWYAINPNAFDKYQISILQKIQIHLGKNTNGFNQNHKPIPDSKQIVNTNSKTDVFTEKEKNPFFESVEAWINENAPSLNKMTNPLTESECMKIKNDYSPEQMKSMFLKMHNYKPLLKKNKSTYLTFKNWMERETSNKPQKSKMKSI